VVDCSDMFYSAPNNLLLPGMARVMGEGWETVRRRDEGNDWVMVRLVEECIIHQVDVDITHFKGNSPGWCRLTGGADPAQPDDWVELIPRTRLQPDTPHRFRCQLAEPIRFVKVDVYPDGGFARLRVFGDLTSVGRERIGLEWYNRLPASRAAAVLVDDTGIGPDAAVALAAARPMESQEDEPLIEVTDPGLGLRQAQPQWGQHTGHLVPESICVRFGACTMITKSSAWLMIRHVAPPRWRCR
jgi:allantoicase